VHLLAVSLTKVKLFEERSRALLQRSENGTGNVGILRDGRGQA